MCAYARFSASPADSLGELDKAGVDANLSSSRTSPTQGQYGAAPRQTRPPRGSSTNGGAAGVVTAGGAQDVALLRGEVERELAVLSGLRQQVAMLERVAIGSDASTITNGAGTTTASSRAGSSVRAGASSGGRGGAAPRQVGVAAQTRAAAAQGSPPRRSPGGYARTPEFRSGHGSRAGGGVVANGGGTHQEGAGYKAYFHARRATGNGGNANGGVHGSPALAAAARGGSVSTTTPDASSAAGDAAVAARDGRLSSNASGASSLSSGDSWDNELRNEMAS